MDTIETTAAVLLIVGAASLFGWVLTVTKVTEHITLGLLSISDNPYVILLIINLILLVIGCFLEPIASISILVPVLMPVLLKVGIDPIHFGVVMTLNLMIGLLHPPLGMVLFVLARSGKPLDRARHHGDSALAHPSPRLADRHHAHPRDHALAPSDHGTGEVGASMSSRMRLARTSIANGLVMICMPDARMPWAAAAFSA